MSDTDAADRDAVEPATPDAGPLSRRRHCGRRPAPALDRRRSATERRRPQEAPPRRRAAVATAAARRATAERREPTATATTDDRSDDRRRRAELPERRRSRGPDADRPRGRPSGALVAASPRSATRRPGAGARRRDADRRRRRPTADDAAAPTAASGAAAAAVPRRAGAGRRGAGRAGHAPTVGDERGRARRGDAASAGAAASARAGRSAATSCACTCGPSATQIAVLEGRSLIEHYVVRPADDVTPDPRQHLPRPGAERAARHGGRVRRHRHAEERRALPRRRRSTTPRTSSRSGEQPAHRADAASHGRLIVCQVTKNPIGAKGARLTQEVSPAGPVRRADPELAETYGISKRLPDDERKRLRGDPRPGASPHEHGADRAHRGRGRRPRTSSSATCAACSTQWEQIEALGQAAEGAGAALPRAATWPCG